MRSRSNKCRRICLLNADSLVLLSDKNLACLRSSLLIHFRHNSKFPVNRKCPGHPLVGLLEGLVQEVVLHQEVEEGLPEAPIHPRYQVESVPERGGGGNVIEIEIEVVLGVEAEAVTGIYNSVHILAPNRDIMYCHGRYERHSNRRLEREREREKERREEAERRKKEDEERRLDEDKQRRKWVVPNIIM